MTPFKDNFSKQAGIYAQYRPHYPKELYAFLSSITKERHLAWDCGTGNGQAAIGLAAFYDHIIATDPSEQQISNCIPNDKITYRVEKAENNSIESESVDLLTIANALHWFDHDVFYKEANRVLKPGGIIAAWTYGVPKVNTEVDKIVMAYHDNTLNDFWYAESRLVDNEYRGIPFPFQQLETPGFITERNMNLDEFIGYLNTWSATQRFIDTHHFNPTDNLKNVLAGVWKDNAEKKLTWKLVLKVGRRDIL